MELKINEMIIEKPVSEKPKISYEEILMKMGMFVSNGKLHLIDNSPKNITNNNEQIPQYSYIHNKYFKDSLKPEPVIKIPKTKEEYKQMLVEEQMNRIKMNEIKSKKLLIPNTIIRTSVSNRFSMNRLFNSNNLR
jgi:hypothetical protein